MSPVTLLKTAFQHAVAAADPLRIVPPHLPALPAGARLWVVGAGKAGGSMAQAVEQHYATQIASQTLTLQGVVITRYGHVAPTQQIEMVEAGHPMPDDAGERAAQRIEHIVQHLQAGDHLLVLVSGGGSSLLALPVAGVSMADLRRVTADLLRCGAPIGEMNIVRKHLSRLQGGHLARLAAARGAQLTALMISDVAGDDLSTIASGPTVPDPSTYADAWAICQRYQLTLSASVQQHLQQGMTGEVAETPKADAPCFASVRNILIASAQQSLALAQQLLQAQGYRVLNLGDALVGEAQGVAADHAAQVLKIRRRGEGKVAILSGGECTVTLPAAAHSTSRGGRCSEYLLALGLKLHDLGCAEGVHALAADTDGIDGSEDNAGAWWTPTSLANAAQADVAGAQALAQHDAYGFFQAAGSLLHTGPTRTNVNDFRLILLD